MPDSKRLRRAGWFALALAILGIAGLLIVRNGAHGAAAADAPPRASAPPSGASIYDQTLNDPEGRPQALGQWKGKLLVLNFWATWCAPCVAEMPDLDKAQREYAGRNVAIVGVGTEEPARVREFRDRIGLHEMTLLAGGYDALLLARTLGNTQGVLPYTVLVSADGVVLHTQTGPLAPDQLRTWLAAKP
jgi:thiol-disulfide isomerase/thioredoxin